MGNNYGAKSSDWDKFISLGLTADLLPVVSNLALKISILSKMKAAGKTPSIMNSRGFIAGLPGWTTKEATGKEVAGWRQNPDYGICIQTRSVRALDIDVEDTEKSQYIKTYIEDFLFRYLPVRYRNNSGRFLLTFRIEEGEYKKRKLEVDGGIIEFLATGQQFVAAGTHTSGERYKWDWKGHNDFPIIKAIDFEKLWLALVEHFGTAPVIPSKVCRPKNPNLEINSANVELLQNMLEFIDSEDYDTWIKIGMALHHETDGSQEGLNIWDEWSSNASNYASYEELENKWNSFHNTKSKLVTINTIKALAYNGGWIEDRSQDFDLLPNEQAKPFVLESKDHSDIANKLLSAKFSNAKDITLLRNGGAWYEYRGKFYVEQTGEYIRATIRKFLDRALKYDNKRLPVPFHPSVQQINAVVDALGAAVLNEDISAPAWIVNDDLSPDPKDLVSLSNGLLHIPSRKLLRHTAKFFTLNTLPYEWQEDGGEPKEWLKFLDALWPNDKEAKQTLQEIFGYLLTADTSQHKMFLIVGPTRSGKGVIARILKALLGQANICGPTLNGMTSNFGLQPLINKLVAIVSDARIGGRSDKKAIVEKLLVISGEDVITIDRKHIQPWTGLLGTRLILLTNEIPRLEDASNAFSGRFITLKMEHSFLGKEDIGLEAKLLKELPQILAWALDGKDRLNKRGHFIQPKSAASAVEELQMLNNPIAQFVTERCEIGANHKIEKRDLYLAYRDWCEQAGRNHPAMLEIFSRDLLNAERSIKASKLSPSNGRIPIFKGICLKNEDLEL